MPLSQIFFWAVPVVALISYCILMLVFTIAQKDRMNKIFMLVLAALIIWTSSALLMRMQLYPGVLFWNRIMVTGTVLVPFLLYCFVSVFTNNIKSRRTILFGILTFIAIAANLMGFIVTDANVTTTLIEGSDINYTAYEFSYTLSNWAYALYGFYFFMIIATLVKTLRFINLRSNSYGQIGLITAGLLLLFIGSLLNIFPNIGKYPFDILATLLNSFLIVVSIYKYRMLELRFILTKGIVYSLFTILVTAGYIFSAFTLQSHFGTPFESATRYIVLFSTLLLAIVFQPMYKLTGKAVDRMFHKSDYSQRQALKNFSLGISNNLDLKQISKELIEAVKLAMPAKDVMLLLKEEDENYYSMYRTSSRVFNPNFQISTDNPVVKWLASNKNSISRKDLYSQPFFKSMWEKEKRDLYDLDIEVITPIECRNDLIGMLLLSRKKNNTAYLQDDLDLLTYLGSSSGVAIDNARLFAKTQIEALTDNLTGLYNHRYFCKVLPEEIEKAGFGELSLLLLDLDLFKLYNDLYGHVEGDEALKTISMIMKKNIGQKGTIFRYGGEEFVILLPEYDSQRAFSLAECIRLDVEKTFLNRNDVTQRFLTVSIGICAYPQGAPNGDELLKRADLAMYTAKSNGKNQTVIYSPNKNPGNAANEPHEAFSVKPANAATIYALTAAIDAKDHYTFGHSQRVAEYSSILAHSMGLDYSHQQIIREAALLHDIGKIGIPETILTKSEKLDLSEYDVVKKHVEICITIIKHLSSQNHVIPAVLGHHERWDGKGYPRGIKGENIPIAARCLAVCDAFDAMTSNRPYSPGIGIDLALNEIRKNMGTQFDPEIARLFITLVRNETINVKSIMDRFSGNTIPEEYPFVKVPV